MSHDLGVYGFDVATAAIPRSPPRPGIRIFKADFNVLKTPCGVSAFQNKMFKRTIKHLQHTVSPTFLPVQLIAIAFCTGILDATTYADFQTFASNQTGNAIMLPVGMMGVAHVQMLGTGVSLATFLFFGCVSGQIGHVFGHRKRWWMLLSSFIQATFVLIPAVLLYTGSVNISPQNAPLLLFFLATSAGFQVAMARNLDVNEVPTAMLTSPFIDFLTDRHLLSGKWSNEKVMCRNRRLFCACLYFN